MKLLFYFHTLRHLRLIQFFDRLRRRMRKIHIYIDNMPTPRSIVGQWIEINIAESRMITERDFLFLNKTGKIQKASDWNDNSQEKLWLYNLHYFEDLISAESSERIKWHRTLLDNWIRDNPAPKGNGWEPYPQSLRIVNWIKWFLNGQMPEAHWLQSLAQQAHVLSQSLEYHLLGNHLFSNGKALVFAGLYLDGEQAEKWLLKGLEIIDAELKEQLLTDGGNFELSPMYHNIMLHDLLDLLNIARAYSNTAVNLRLASWHHFASAMLGWMETMLHPDGDIAFFNDAAMGVAPTPQKLKSYAYKLQVEPNVTDVTACTSTMAVYQLAASGYIRIDNGPCTALLDCARIGPEYIPGHAHADTLSFEMSLYGQRLFVNSGTSCYGIDDERLRQRGTAAHNTVEVEGTDSSEIWAGFRVARRAYPSHVDINSDLDDGISIGCSHNGYMRLKGNVTHHRSWRFFNNFLQVVDHLSGIFSDAKVYYHLHPNIDIEKDMQNQCYILTLISGHQARLKFEKTELYEIEPSSWHPEFGKSIENRCLVAEFASDSIVTTIEW